MNTDTVVVGAIVAACAGILSKVLEVRSTRLSARESRADQLLEERLDELEADRAELRETIKLIPGLEAELQRAKAQIVDLTIQLDVVDELRDENTRLRAENDELRGRVGHLEQVVERRRIDRDA